MTSDVDAPRLGKRFLGRLSDFAFGLFLVGFLTGWEILSRSGAISAVFFPAPSTILQEALTMSASGELFASISATLGRIGLGFMAGTLAAVLLGLWMGVSRSLRSFVDPIVACLHPIPKIAVFPLVMIFLGIGESSKVAVIALATFFPVMINTMEGVRGIDRVYLDVARSYGAVRWPSLLTRILLPGSLPFVLTGVRIGLNVALLVTIAIEIVAAEKGLGAIVWRAWETMRTEQMYVALLVISLIGVGSIMGLDALRKALAPWHEAGASSA